MPPHALLTNEDRTLLAKVSNLLEELVETTNILEDKEAMKAIKQADKDVKEPKTTARQEKPLRGSLSGKWSLKLGNYRIIYVIDEKEKTILLYDVEHRKKVYK